MLKASNRGNSEKSWIIFVLIVALIHGSIYVFLVPPWQHYDEPNHFEYVWILSNQGHLPAPGEPSTDLSPALIDSMIANGFYGGMGAQREIPIPSDRAQVPGVSQFDEPPFYYYLVSLPIRIFNPVDVKLQLYISRIVSLIAYLASILIAWGITREITPPGNLLRMVVPFSLAMLPGYTDIMTSVNNDVGAVIIVSLSLWGGLRLIVRGFSILDFLWTLIPTLLAYVTKNTAVVAFIIPPVSLLFSLLRGNSRKYAWTLIVLGMMVGFVVSIDWGDANLWYRSTTQKISTRVEHEKAVIGRHVFVIDPAAEITPQWMLNPIFQPIPIGKVNQLKGKTVTLGAWVWADGHLETRSPLINTNNKSYYQNVTVSEEPHFITFQVEIPVDINKMWVSLFPPKPETSNPTKVYYDGVVLTEGDKSLQEAPVFNSEDATTGNWGGEEFTNLIRNGSAESASLRFRPWIDSLGSRFLRDNARPSLVLTSLMDVSGSGWLHEIISIRLLRTFWAKFGWGHVALVGGHPYRWLGIITLFGIFGSILSVLKKWSHISWDVIFLLLIVIIVSWGAAFVGGAIFVGVPHTYIPVARHAYPAIIPTLIVLCFGWIAIFRGMIVLTLSILKRIGFMNLQVLKIPDNSLPDRVIILLMFTFFILLDFYSIVSIAHHYGFLDNL
ncbi:ArnT family glycosyltransferase [Chloroflexota bacterium]